MTDPPVLLPNARHQSAKTGFASLPPRPVNIASLPPKPGGESSNTPSRSHTNQVTQEVFTTVRDGSSSNSSGGGRENGSGVSSLPQIPSSAMPSSSFSSRSSSDIQPVTSSPQIATPTSSSLGKRPFDNLKDPAETASSSNIMIENPEPRIIPILPTPLPSKRFKKGSQARASLVPVEQLPVFPLPPLPVISDPILEKQVFTHQSCFPRRKWRFEDPEEDPSLDYEKLEHVGDSILGMVVTTWLHELKPRLTCGRASKLKSHLVSNATLSHISGLYNLPARLVGPPNLLPVLKAQTDVRAAMVEAYIAAIYFSYPVEKRMTEGLKVIDEWLRDMYEPLYDFFLNHMQTEYDQHRTAISSNPDGTVQTISNDEMERIDKASMGMAALIRVYGDNQGRDVKYEEERHETNLGILWRVKCVVDGIEIGEATRANKQTAKNVAAWTGAKKLGLATDE